MAFPTHPPTSHPGGVLRTLRTLHEQELKLHQVPDITGLSQTRGGGILGQHSNVLRVLRLCKGQNLSWNLPRDTPLSEVGREIIYCYCRVAFQSCD